MREIKFRAWDKEKERMLMNSNQYGPTERVMRYIRTIY